MRTERRIIRIPQVAEMIGLAPATVRRFVADAQREPDKRRYPPHLHERIPPMWRDGKHWVTTQQTLDAHMRRRSKQWGIEA